MVHLSLSDACVMNSPQVGSEEVQQVDNIHIDDRPAWNF